MSRVASSVGALYDGLASIESSLPTASQPRPKKKRRRSLSAALGLGLGLAWATSCSLHPEAARQRWTLFSSSDDPPGTPSICAPEVPDDAAIAVYSYSLVGGGLNRHAQAWFKGGRGCCVEEVTCETPRSGPPGNFACSDAPSVRKPPVDWLALEEIVLAGRRLRMKPLSHRMAPVSLHGANVTVYIEGEKTFSLDATSLRGEMLSVARASEALCGWQSSFLPSALPLSQSGSAD